MATALDVDALRAQTPGAARVTHLNNAGAALPPAVVTDTIVEHLRLEEAIGGYEAHAVAQERMDAVYGSVGRLLGARPDQVALVESATEGWSRAFQAVQFSRGFGPGDRLLVSSAEYASNVLPLLQVAAHQGATVEFIPDDANGCVDVSAFAGMLDERVALVAVTHCPSQNGLINDVDGIGAALRGSGAWYLIDACQSAGQLPLDVTTMGADFVSATGRKFLRGPRGTGFLYASDRATAELEPFPLDCTRPPGSPTATQCSPGRGGSSTGSAPTPRCSAWARRSTTRWIWASTRSPNASTISPRMRAKPSRRFRGSRSATAAYDEAAS